MKPCHAAALAGWLLLYPPWTAQQKAPDPTMPRSRWYQMATFDSLANCEENKIKFLEEIDRKTLYADPDKMTAQERMRHLALCVSASDSRLKSN